MATDAPAPAEVLAGLVAVFAAPGYPDRRMEDPHYAGPLLHRTAAALTDADRDPAAAEAAANALATSPWFLLSVSTLLEGGHQLAFVAARCLLLALTAAPAVPHAAVAKHGRLIAVLAGAAAFPDPLLRAAALGCLHALCLGPSRAVVATRLLADGGPLLIKVVEGGFGDPGTRRGAGVVVGAVLSLVLPPGDARRSAAKKSANRATTGVAATEKKPLPLLAQGPVGVSDAAAAWALAHRARLEPLLLGGLLDGALRTALVAAPMPPPPPPAGSPARDPPPRLPMFGAA